MSAVLLAAGCSQPQPKFSAVVPAPPRARAVPGPATNTWYAAVRSVGVFGYQTNVTSAEVKLASTNSRPGFTLAWDPVVVGKAVTNSTVLTNCVVVTVPRSTNSEPVTNYVVLWGPASCTYTGQVSAGTNTTYTLWPKGLPLTNSLTTIDFGYVTNLASQKLVETNLTLKLTNAPGIRYYRSFIRMTNF